MPTLEIMLAQGLVEHGALSSLAESFQRTTIVVEDFVRHIDPRVAIGIVLVLIVLLVRRR
jgi:hypothetical protein